MTDQIQITKENNKANIVLDMSMLDLFILCPCRYNYRHNHQKALPIEQKGKALDYGSMAHEGFEYYFKTLQAGKHFNDAVHAGIERIQIFASDPELSNVDEEETNLILSAFQQSCEFWRHEDETFEILEVEQAFAYVLFEDEYIRIIITGKIDLLVNKPALGRNAGYTNLPLDHKTFQRDFPVPRLSNQFQNYCNAVQSNFIIVNRVGLQKTLKPEEKYKRIPLSYDRIILDDWKKNITYIILNEYATCLSEGYWPMRTTSCFAWNRGCEYLRICEASGAEAKAFGLEQHYMIAPMWDVTKKLEK